MSEPIVTKLHVVSRPAQIEAAEAEALAAMARARDFLSANKLAKAADELKRAAAILAQRA